MKILLSQKLRSRFLFISLTIFSAYMPVTAGTLVIASLGDSKIVLVDSKTYKTLATLDSAKSPHELRISRDKRRAYVAAGKTITVIDLRKRTVHANFDLGEYSTHDIRVSRDGRRIWAACADKEAVLELDSESGRVLRTFDIKQKGAWFLEITPDEKKIYTPNLEGKSVSIITRATGEVKIIPFENAVYGIDITPNGKHVWVSGTNLSVIDTATDKVTATIKTSEAATGRIRITADGKKLVVALAKKLAVYDVKKHTLINLTELTVRPKVLTLSADNRRAFLTNPADNSVAVVDVAGGKLLTTFQTSKSPDGIGWVD